MSLLSNQISSINKMFWWSWEAKKKQATFSENIESTHKGLWQINTKLSKKKFFSCSWVSHLSRFMEAIDWDITCCRMRDWLFHLQISLSSVSRKWNRETLGNAFVWWKDLFNLPATDKVASNFAEEWRLHAKWNSVSQHM